MQEIKRSGIFIAKVKETVSEVWKNTATQVQKLSSLNLSVRLYGYNVIEIFILIFYFTMKMSDGTCLFLREEMILF